MRQAAAGGGWRPDMLNKTKFHHRIDFHSKVNIWSDIKFYWLFIDNGLN
jgi:hypothetical protein